MRRLLLAILLSACTQRSPVERLKILAQDVSDQLPEGAGIAVRDLRDGETLEIRGEEEFEHDVRLLATVKLAIEGKAPQGDVVGQAGGRQAVLDHARTLGVLRASPRDYVVLLDKLWHGEIVSPAVSRSAVDRLRKECFVGTRPGAVVVLRRADADPARCESARQVVAKYLAEK